MPLYGDLVGSATFLQADVEPIQGLHFMATGESYTPGKQGSNYGAWLACAWFFALHLDARVDIMKRNEVYGGVRIPESAYMAQLHLSL